MEKDKPNAPRPSISITPTGMLVITVLTLFILIAGLLYWLFAEHATTDWSVIRSLLIVCAISWIALACLSMLIFIANQLWIRNRVKRGANSAGETSEIKRTQVQPTLNYSIATYLRKRYRTGWRRKVRILLITGDDNAIALLLPDLRAKQWLEGRRTVLIYGGTLAGDVEVEKYAALRKLRRGRPLDGIVRVLGEEQILTPQLSDGDLRGLEKIGEVLHYQPPVYLWQLCASVWPQAERVQQAVGATWPVRATPDDIEKQLRTLLPSLRAQGLAQVAEHLAHDFLLRLAQQLEQGGIEGWKNHLAPWLYVSQQRVPLRGLMFSLAEPVPLPEQVERAVAPAMPSSSHALALPLSWQGVIDDCARLRGRRVGMAWERACATAMMVAMGVGCAGLLISFMANRAQIVSVADKTQALITQRAVTDGQLTALHALRNDAGRLQHQLQHGAPWYQRFGLNHNQALLNAMLPWYGVLNNRLIRDPAEKALRQRLTKLANLPPESPLRAELAKPGYDQLKAWLMMSRPDKVDAAFYVQTMQSVQPTYPGISTALWQSLSPDLWAFSITELSHQPQWKITPDMALVLHVRQILLQQIGRRNAESTLYENMLKSVRRNFADVTLDDMTNGTDARRLFATNEIIPGMFTRQAWEGEIEQAIEKAANSRRDEIDWVLSGSKQRLSSEVSPEALKARLRERYFTDFAGSWLNFLNNLRWNPANNIADVTDQLTLMSDVRQSPLIALMNTLAWQGQAGQKNAKLAESVIKSAKELIQGSDKPVIDQSVAGPAGPLDETFGPLLTLMGKNKAESVMSADSSLSLQTYLTRITRVRLRLQQVANAPDPQEMMQTLAQTVFHGKSVDLTDTQQYGSLIAASLGEEWNGFGQTMFVQPLTQAWETVLQPSAASLNDTWHRAIVNHWQTAFEGRYPFAVSKSEASLPMLAEFIRKDTGRIERFLAQELGGILHKEGSQWVPDSAHSQGLTFNPAFLSAINQLSKLSDILFTDGNQGISFELQARPAANVVETELTIDGQKLHYFNQMADWQTFRWPGNTYKPGTMLTWTPLDAGAKLWGDYTGTWGFIRWLESGKRQPLDNSQWMMNFITPEGETLQWVLRSQLENGPLALLQLRQFTLPAEIFTIAMESDLQLPEDNMESNEQEGEE